MNPSPDQSQALEKLIQFTDPENPLQAFILRGSAGTGKTTLVKSVLDQLPKHYETVELCAFTNKAAKVLAQKTNIRAITLHRLLHQIDTDHTKATSSSAGAPLMRTNPHLSWWMKPVWWATAASLSPASFLNRPPY